MSLLGDNLKTLRGSRSQREMAEAIGIKYQAWDRYEKGKVSPGADILQQICRIHQCSADWLLGLPAKLLDPQLGEFRTMPIEKLGKSSLITAMVRQNGDPGEAPLCQGCKFKAFAEAFKAIQSPV